MEAKNECACCLPLAPRLLPLAPLHLPPSTCNRRTCNLPAWRRVPSAHCSGGRGAAAPRRATGAAAHRRRQRHGDVVCAAPRPCGRLSRVRRTPCNLSTRNLQPSRLSPRASRLVPRTCFSYIHCPADTPCNNHNQPGRPFPQRQQSEASQRKSSIERRHDSTGDDRCIEGSE